MHAVDLEAIKRIQREHRRDVWKHRAREAGVFLLIIGIASLFYAGAVHYGFPR